LVVSPLNSLAGIAAARGDLGAASAAYETLLERCRATGQHLYVSFTLLALARLRARQGDDTLADRLYDEAIACGFNPWLSADAMVGQAAVARRLGDLTRARALLDRAEDQYRAADLPAGRPLVLAGLAWWALAAGCPADATVFAAQAASPSGDPATQLLANTAVAAVKAILTLAQQRESGPAYPILTDEPDVAALAARLARPPCRRPRPSRTPPTGQPGPGSSSAPVATRPTPPSS